MPFPPLFTCDRLHWRLFERYKIVAPYSITGNALMMNILTLCSSLSLLLVLALIRTNRLRSTRPLPPGPKGLPLIGSLLEIPSRLLFLKLVEWSNQSGPLISYKVLGQVIVVVSSAKAAGDILDRLSAKTSDRPRYIKAEYLTHNMDFGFVNRGAFWRTQRRAAHESLNVRAAKDFQLVQNEESRMLVEGLLLHPEIDIAKHIYRHSSSVAWRVIYGHEALKLEVDEPGLPSDSFFAPLLLAAVPGGSIVDILPFLHPLISRSKFIRRYSDEWYERASAFFVKAHVAPQVEGMPSLSAKLKELGEKIGMSGDEDCGWLGGTLYIAAQDTTATSLKWFLIAMLLHPQAAAAVRRQLDQVVGNRFPTFEDMDNLSHIHAIIKEVLRWRPPTPTGVPHAASEDIMYDKYLIPKGAILIANSWSIGRDPSMYPDGETFDPSRFLDEQGDIKPSSPDSHDNYPVFGHGRRICVGKTLAINTLLIAVARLLWAFEFEPVRDEHGQLLPDPMKFRDNGLTVWPAEFQIRLVPRFPDLLDRLDVSPEEG
ncbi:cytochrome P450 [Dacryopinax primogenitus]|uniref:Cytochrome P450 n=1 Tax=Dacryopinax primogenitus (strain DJM 731) TaxID=1858805 RepID=M5FY67_DACPD|nr:cytochrome P450 [Dacryopinax primogenitus]EJU00745.1 cytochrome P450 [Dacryopinax primogenitus]